MKNAQKVDYRPFLVNWVSCEEQLPAEGKTLFFTDGKYIWLGKRCADDFGDNIWHRCELVPIWSIRNEVWESECSLAIKTPTHWGELPAIPQKRVVSKHSAKAFQVAFFVLLLCGFFILGFRNVLHLGDIVPVVSIAISSFFLGHLLEHDNV
jgi:hypothetical protein